MEGLTCSLGGLLRDSSCVAGTVHGVEGGRAQTLPGAGSLHLRYLALPVCDCWEHHSSERLCPRDCCCAGLVECRDPTYITMLRAPLTSGTDNSCAGQSQQSAGVPEEGDAKHHQERELALPCCQVTRTRPPHHDLPLYREAKPCLAAYPAHLPWVSPAPLGVPFPYGIPGKGLGWGAAFSPIAAGLRWSESPDPDMEGPWGMEGAGDATSPLCACPRRRHGPSWSSCWTSLRPTFHGSRAV